MTNNVRIDANQTFTEMAKGLHEQFKQTGGQGAVRADYKGLYVKGNSEFWDKNVALTSQSLKDRFDKFSTAERTLSDAIDREFQGAMVDGQTLGKYVTSGVFKDGEVHRIDEKTLNLLEARLKEALDAALATALQSGDQHTVDLLSDRQRVLDADERHQDDPAALERGAGWREKVSNYRALRDALAKDLGALGGGDPSGNQQALRAQADEILMQLDVIHTGLTDATIDNITAALSVAYGSDAAQPDANFENVRGLHDKVRMNNAIAANSARLEALSNELAPVVDKNKSSPIFNDDFFYGHWERANFALSQTASTISSIEFDRKRGDLNDEATVKKHSQDLVKCAADMAKSAETFLRYNQDEIMNGDGHVVLPEAARTYVLMQAHVKATYDLAKSLVSPEDRMGLEAKAEDEHYDVFKYKGINSPQRDIATLFNSKTSSAENRALQAQLSTPTVLYQSDSSGASARSSVAAHNENMGRVWDMAQVFQATGDAQTLDGLRADIDRALGSYYDLTAQLQKSEQHDLKSGQLLGEKERNTLRIQGNLLQRAAFSADSLRKELPDDGVSLASIRAEAGDAIEDSWLGDEIDVDALPKIPDGDENNVDASAGGRNGLDAFGNIHGASGRDRMWSTASDESDMSDYFISPQELKDRELKRSAQAQGQSPAKAGDASEVPRDVVQQGIDSDTAKRFPASYKPISGDSGAIPRSNEMSGDAYSTRANDASSIRDDISVSTQNAEPLDDELSDNEFEDESDVLNENGRDQTPGWEGKARKLNAQNAAASTAGRERTNSDEEMYRLGTPTPGGDDKDDKNPPKGHSMHDLV